MENIIEVENQYVIFRIHNDSYAIDISMVKTIEKVEDFTRIPNSEGYIKGVINLRGEVIPVIDLKKRLGIGEIEINENSRVIITYRDEIVVGLLVDASSEVVYLQKDEIDNPPNINESEDYNYIKGIGKKNDKLILIIDLDRILDIEREE
ncbi:chemotaxis protein CheW [Clostridium sp. D2Q-11]|uniref:Chemotaxis protein CheW n=1 Tax=Anaeromonas frigoriresistens TaxID=2683708 RepID=A0A942UZX8_9FIRM|nr:chemotaxis protein CheW [Anaeromonas frigoriresistens]MBS4539869.1 chemotaxis protein CheW [Anaeromonas frigoriresistens]